MFLFLFVGKQLWKPQEEVLTHSSFDSVLIQMLSLFSKCMPFFDFTDTEIASSSFFLFNLTEVIELVLCMAIRNINLHMWFSFAVWNFLNSRTNFRTPQFIVLSDRCATLCPFSYFFCFMTKKRKQYCVGYTTLHLGYVVFFALFSYWHKNFHHMGQ